DVPTEVEGDNRSRLHDGAEERARQARDEGQARQVHARRPGQVEYPQFHAERAGDQEQDDLRDWIRRPEDGDGDTQERQVPLLLHGASLCDRDFSGHLIGVWSAASTSSPMQNPQTRYVRRGEVSIAYQVVGARGPDLIIVPGFISHLDLQWTDLAFSRFLERLASFTRLILYDKPGTGLSDPIPRVPTLEERIAAVRPGLAPWGSEQD